MKGLEEFDMEEILEHLKINGMNESYRNLKAELDAQRNIDASSVSENDNNPIAEYENLSKKMQKKIKEIIESMKAEKEKEIKQELGDKDQSDDRDEKNTLDEKDGKEELDEDKKKEVEEAEKERGKEEGTDKTDEEKDEKEKEDESREEKSKKDKEETPKKDEYLAKLEKLHKMRIVDYRDQLKKDDVQMDRYFVTMIYLQKELNRTRNAFVKEYGDEELTYLENQYLKEELKYQKELDIRMERDLSKLRQLNEKLDSILDRMQALQQGLEDGNISIEEYNDEIDVLEKDKLDTLWQINRLNPALLEEKQEIIVQREEFEKGKVSRNIQKEKATNPELKAKQKSLDNMKQKHEGVAEEAHNDMKKEMDEYTDEKEKRLYELRKELEGIDIESPQGKERALQIIGEIQALEAQKASHEIQQDNLQKNMNANVQSYGDLKKPETDRAEDTEEFQSNITSTKPEDWSNDMLQQLKSDVKDTPSTPEQAQELVDNMNKIAEEAKKESEKREEPEEDKEKTLFRKKYNSNN